MYYVGTGYIHILSCYINYVLLGALFRTVSFLFSRILNSQGNAYLHSSHYFM